jgi:SAM-dependent methyltransferase
LEPDEYARIAEAEKGYWWYRATRQLITDLLTPYAHAKGRFLDAGGGTGAIGGWLAERGSLVLADLEPAALDYARRLHPDIDGLVRADLEHPPFPDESFDVVLCVTVLYHEMIRSPAVAAGQLGRLVKPGGVLCLLEPGVRRLHRAHDRVVHMARRFSRRDLHDLLTANGFVIEKSTGAYTFLVPPAAVKTVVERGRTASDLEETALSGVLERLAKAERALLKRVSLPFGLSVVALGRKPVPSAVATINRSGRRSRRARG